MRFATAGSAASASAASNLLALTLRIFFCAEKKLIIEIDGEQHAFEPNRISDRRRTEWLRAQGYTVIRFWTNEVMHELDGVCEAILGRLTW